MIQGSLVALVTPMAENGAVDTARLQQLIDFHIDQGSDAIVAVGTTGESATLNEKEHCDLINSVVEHVAGRLPVIAGTGANSTSEAITLTQHAKEVGADACLLVTPYYNKPMQEGLYQHFKVVAEAVDIPQILYNVPGRTGCDLLPETVIRLAPIDNIVGIKEATGELDRVTTIRQQCGDAFALYSGDDATSREFCLLGGNGAITVTGNVAPQLMHQMLSAAMEGERDRAEALDALLVGLHQALVVESNPITVQWALHEMGLIGQGIRLPLTWLPESCYASVRAALQQAKVL